MVSMYERVMNYHYKRYQNKYDKEIRESCEHYREKLANCLKRLQTSENCQFDTKNFETCILNFDTKFRFKYRVPK